MKRKMMALGMVAAVGLLAACQPTTQSQVQANCAVSTVGGAALGGVLGNQFGNGSGRDVATVGGAIAGGLIGSNAGCY